MAASRAKTAAPKPKSAVDWRTVTLDRMRALILEADPEIAEEIKWKKPANGMAGVPVWSRHGIVCTGETYAQYVKLTFAHGAKIDDPASLFNSSLTGATRRAIDIREGEAVDAAAFRELIRAAVAFNAAPAKTVVKNKPVKLLTGGNPQIAKGEGDAPVRAYIDAMPGWKSDIGRRVDALIARTAPDVKKAVKWNSPFYGVEGRGWFLGMHVFAKYVKLAFFRGTLLKPPPPGTSKSPEVRYLDIRETDALDEKQLEKWVKQAAALPGWLP